MQNQREVERELKDTLSGKVRERKNTQKENEQKDTRREKEKGREKDTSDTIRYADDLGARESAATLKELEEKTYIGLLNPAFRL